MNQIWIVSRGSIDGAILKILVLCVSWFARKFVYRQTDRQTDRHGENISVFFPMRKKALKRGNSQNYIVQTSNLETKFLINLNQVGKLLRRVQSLARIWRMQVKCWDVLVPVPRSSKILVPETAKLQGPIHIVRVQRTVKSPWAADRRRQLYGSALNSASMSDRYDGARPCKHL